MLSNQVHPTQAQLEELKKYPQDKPLVMLNILRFKEETETGETGQQAYERYFKNAAPFVEKTQAKLIWKGEVISTLIGNSEQQPHITFLMEYPSVNHFLGMAANPEYQKIATDRSIALEYGGLMVCQSL